MSLINRLQSWYLAQCNGDWEHSYGIRISTLDNPGWSVSINLKDTSIENTPFAGLSFERSENDWLFATKKDCEFKIACGPENLEEGLNIFLKWADEMPVSQRR